MSADSKLHALFFAEPLPPEYAGTNYRAFRAVLPTLSVTGPVRSITLTPQGKLEIVGVDNGQLYFVPKKDPADRKESHIVLVPGGTISPELLAKP